MVNSLKHGGGNGHVSIWTDGGSVICEVRDNGRFEEPLAGRRRPLSTSESGRGLWMANQLCDLVQIRNIAGGSIVRLHKRLGATRD
jgi:anti-sigma regulatory factor (Ser/Thr protein kinase)